MCFQSFDIIVHLSKGNDDNPGFGSSAREKEENMRTVESLLEKGLIQVANKEEELKVGFLVEKYMTAHVKPSNVLEERRIKGACICLICFVS